MKRRIVLLVCSCLLALSTSVIHAQDPIPTLPPPDQLQPVVTPEVLAPEDAGGAEPAPTEAAPPLDPSSQLGVEQSEALPIVVAVLNDINLLATAALGGDLRPVGWTGSRDVTNPQLPILLRLDLELLAGAVVGADNRPVGWFGVVASVPVSVARDLRHDLELLADIVIGAQGVRPAGWQGDDPLYRCSRATQALFAVFERDGLTIQIDFTQPDYCAIAENAATRYVERTIVQPPAAVSLAAAAAAGGVDLNARYPSRVEGPFVSAFADRRARRKVGILPIGTGYEAVSRSYVEFSNMMLVRGEGFYVFVDYTTTTLTYEQFLGLPNLGDGEPVTTCTAEWCGRNID